MPVNTAQALKGKKGAGAAGERTVIKNGFKQIKNKSPLGLNQFNIGRFPGKFCQHAHHIIGIGEGSMGATACDYETIPLCRPHHDFLHQDVGMFEQVYGSQETHVRKTLQRAIFQGELIQNKNGSG